MPIKSPDEPVFYDSNINLWAAVREGIVDSTDVTRSGRLRADMSIELPVPSPTNWAANIQATSPYGLQSRPFGNSAPTTPTIIKQTPEHPPPAPVRPVRHVRKALGEVTNHNSVEAVQIHILKMELADEERAHKVSRGLLSRFVKVAQQIENV